jgi:hypothetical protein
MKSFVMALVMVLGLAGGGFAADLVSGVCEPEMAGPRAGQCRSFGWQERERMTASSYDYSQFQGAGGDSAAGADASAADAAAAEAAADAAAAAADSDQ